MKIVLHVIIVVFFTTTLLADLGQINQLDTIVVKKDARKLAEYYRMRVMRGESMASIAKLYSEDPGSAQNGGQYNNVTKGMFVPEFEKVAFRLKPNEVSEVFETEFGFHFIQLISRKGDVLSMRHVLITRD